MNKNMGGVSSDGRIREDWEKSLRVWRYIVLATGFASLGILALVEHDGLDKYITIWGFFKPLYLLTYLGTVIIAGIGEGCQNAIRTRITNSESSLSRKWHEQGLLLQWGVMGVLGPFGFRLWAVIRSAFPEFIGHTFPESLVGFHAIFLVFAGYGLLTFVLGALIDSEIESYFKRRRQNS